jgi:pimeloyl-ACP methyl ester carboxylesterase
MNVIDKIMTSGMVLLVLYRRKVMRFLSTAVFLLLTLSNASAADNLPFDNSRYEKIAGVNVHVREWPAAGSNRAACPVLLVHGFAGSTYSYRYLAPHLAAQGHRVVAIDLPAYGYSERRSFPATASEALWPFLNSISTQRWCLVGHSMGTRIIGEMAMLQTARVQSMVYIDGSPIPSTNEMERRKKYSSPTVRRWMAGFAQRFYLKESRIKEMLGKAYGRKPNTDEVQGYYTPLKIPGTALAIMNGYSAKWPPNPTPDVLNTLPSLIVWGEKDAWVKPEVGKRLASTLPAARKQVIANSGHCPMETHSSETNAAVGSFLKANALAINF